MRLPAQYRADYVVTTTGLPILDPKIDDREANCEEGHAIVDKERLPALEKGLLGKLLQPERVIGPGTAADSEQLGVHCGTVDREGVRTERRPREQRPRIKEVE